MALIGAILSTIALGLLVLWGLWLFACIIQQNFFPIQRPEN